LAEAGATPSRYPSKLARVSQVTRPAPSGGTASGKAVAAYLIEQIDKIFGGDLALRRGSDPIHDTRVAIRRLRSTLRVFGKLLEPSVEHVDDELKWFAGLLGEVRDCQVQRQHFREALAQLPSELVLGPVANTIDTDLHSDQLRARTTVAEAMCSPRYLDLLAPLQRWRTDPPLTAPPSTSAVNKRATRAERKADRRLAQAVAGDDDALLHRARKAAKRARYAAELRMPVEKRAKRTVKHYKRIQTVLGDHQDGVVASATLVRLARVAGTTPGQNGFTYGVLYAREQQAADTARRRVGELVG
jgi:CHAD domain-containing protein